jgi:hypothetical protein
MRDNTKTFDTVYFRYSENVCSQEKTSYKRSKKVFESHR